MLSQRQYCLVGFWAKDHAFHLSSQRCEYNYAEYVCADVDMIVLLTLLEACGVCTRLVTGDYITPQFNAQPRFDKPILIYWLMTLSVGILFLCILAM
jgi:hypothetical protein